MRVRDIAEGGYYAVSVNPDQVQDAPEGELIPDWPARRLIEKVERVFAGCKAHVSAIERKENGRPVIRIDCVAHQSKTVERVEDNYDGTFTHWRGQVVDEDENLVIEEVPFEALIEPSQVKEEWTEALIATEVRKMESTLEYRRDTIC